MFHLCALIVKLLPCDNAIHIGHDTKKGLLLTQFKPHENECSETSKKIVSSAVFSPGMAVCAAQSHLKRTVSKNAVKEL